MTTLDQIRRIFALSTDPQPLPIEIRNVGRDRLPSLFAELGFAKGAEIGVWKGEFSEKLCFGIPGLQLTCVDCWLSYDAYSDHVWQKRISAAEDEARARLAPYACTVLKTFSVEAAKQVPDGSLDFVYIDGNHGFEWVVADLAAWSPKVREGGILSGHDYVSFRRKTHLRVIEAIDGWTRAYDINPWFLLGRSKVRPGEIRDKSRSWLWVNEPTKERDVHV